MPPPAAYIIFFICLLRLTFTFKAAIILVMYKAMLGCMTHRTGLAGVHHGLLNKWTKPYGPGSLTIMYIEDYQSLNFHLSFSDCTWWWSS